MSISNLGQRVLVAIFGIPLILSALYMGQWFLVGLIFIINLVSLYEFYRMAQIKGAKPQVVPAMLIGGSIPVFVYLKGLSIIGPLLIAASILFLLIELFRSRPNASFNVATSLMGLIYPSTFLTFLISIREFPKSADIPYEHAGLLLIGFMAIIWICDTAAYFLGRAIGKHKLHERISPKKTIEGGVAGFVGAIVTALLFQYLFPMVLTKAQAVMLGAGIGIFGQIGDLVESIFKRDAGIKDSSAILPGHGGFLDRFDAPMFLAPLLYYFLAYAVY